MRKGILAFVLLITLLVLRPWAGTIGADLGRALWSLHYWTGPLFSQGLHPTEVAFPTGGWWFPEGGLEAVLLAPISAISPSYSWNILWILRILGAAVGTMGLLQRRGQHPGWAVIPALWPGTWALIEQGALETGSLLWLPLVLLAVETRRGVTAAALLAGGAPALFAGTVISLVILRTETFKNLIHATILSSILLLFRVACLIPADSLLPHTRARLLTMEAPESLGGGSLDGAIWGWGSPVIFALLLGRKERSLWLGLAGLLLALGPSLQWGDKVLQIANKAAPLPLMFLQRLPPISANEHIVGFGTLTALALSLVLGQAFSRWTLRKGTEPLLILSVGLLLAVEGFYFAPSLSDTSASHPSEATFFWPLPKNPGMALLQPAMGGGPVNVGLESLLSPSLEKLVTQPIWQLPSLQKELQTQGFERLQVDGQSSYGQGPDLLWLLGPNAPVTGAPWPAVDLQKHSFSSQSTVPVLPEIPEASRDWTNIETGLAGLFDSKLSEKALTEVWMYQSDDGQNWTNPTWIAHSLTSLGIAVSPDGALVLTGMVSLGPSLAPAFPPFHSSAVVTLTSPDLKQWGARRWWLADRLSLVDSEISWENGKPTLSSWVRTGPLGVDPVKLTGSHPLLRASLGADGLFHAQKPTLFVQGLADPQRVSDLLYTTQFILGRQPEVQIYRQNGDTYQKVGSLPGVTVPHVTIQDGMYHLLAHGPGISGRLAMVAATSEDGIHWTQPTPVPGFEEISKCESPVTQLYQGRYVLFCSRRIGDVRQMEQAPG